MEITSVAFKSSSQELSQIPVDGFPEFAFIGRSNVGKSSLINMLTGQKTLAKVSSMPGKTRLINHFLVDDSWYLVDLPGYGYARASKRDREQFERLINDYVRVGEKLVYLFVLVDSRHEPQRIDLEFINSLGEWGVPFGVVFTKSDKQKERMTNQNVKRFAEALLENWEELPSFFVTSSAKKEGGKRIIEFIGSCLEQIEK